MLVATRTRTRTIVYSLLLLLCAGCGTNGPKTYEVTGTVAFDGQPVAAGEIIFRSPEGDQKSWAGKITDGRYQLRSTAGNKRVEITAVPEIRSTSNSASGEPEFVRPTTIPAKYNKQSTLSAEVKPNGSNTFGFDLKP